MSSNSGAFASELLENIDELFQIEIFAIGDCASAMKKKIDMLKT